MNNFSFFKFVSNTIYSRYAKLRVIYIIYISPSTHILTSLLIYMHINPSRIFFFFFLRIQTRSHNPSRFKKVKLKKSQK